MIVASKKPVWITLAVALVFHTVVISLQASRRVDTAFMRVWLIDSLAPAEKLVDSTLHGLGNIWSGYFWLIGVHTENQDLRQQVAGLRMRLERQHEEVLEAQRLRSLLSLKDSIEGRTVVARVIGRDPAQAQETVTIDKGRSSGVLQDAAVITPDGIVGRVISAGNYFSIVQLILDSQSGVGVLVRSTRRQAIVKGSGGSELDLDYIDDDTDIKEGDELITSGTDRIYPKGLPVGTISFVGPRVGIFKTVRIRPKADFGKLEEVLCIVDRPEAVDVVDPSEAHLPPETPMMFPRISTLSLLGRFAISLVAVVVFQGILSFKFKVFGYFDLPLICSVYYGFTLGNPIASVLIGSALGLMQDGLSGSILGTNAFSKTLLGFMAASAGSKFNVDQPITRVFSLFLFTLGDGILVSMLGLMVGIDSNVNYSGAFGRWLLSATFNTLLGLVFFGYHDRLSNATT